MLVPTIYSYFYLAAYWDPYGKTNKIPVALVNEDKGITIDSTEYNFGTNITNSLIALDAFKFSLETASDALDGLEDRTFLAMIRFPSDFTSNIMAAIASEDGNLKPSVIDYRVNQKTSYLGSTIITNGLQTLEQQARSTAVLAVVTQLLKIVSAVQNNQAAIQAALQLLPAMNESSFRYQTDTTSIQTDLSALQTKLTTAYKLCAENGNSCSYTSFDNKDGEGVNLFDTLSQLSTNLNTFWAELNAAGGDIATIRQNNEQVLTTLSAFHLPTTSTLKALPAFTSAPVDMVETDVGKINYYGLAFVPMFVSVGSWLTCLMMMMSLYYDQWHRFGILDSTRNSFTQVFAYLGLACCFGLIDGASLLLNLWFKPTNVFLYFFSCMLIPFTYMSIVLCLVIILDDVGKFIVLILLVFQLGAAGPTFPIQVVAPGLKWLHPILPMTHGIRLMRECIASRNGSLTAQAIGFLFVFVVITLGLTSLYLIIRQRNAAKHTDASDKDENEAKKNEASSASASSSSHSDSKPKDD